MTNQNKAAQPVLTTGQILSMERRSNMTDDEALRFARAIESALLSKLRAPVAENPDRTMLQSVLQDLEKSESVCPQCGHSDSCADMDVAYMIRDHLKGDASAPVADERAAFEAWAQKKKMPLARIGEQYDDFWVDHAWNGWQARAAHASAPVADELPHWEEVSAKLERDETLTPLEFFIYENEPAGGDGADAWRDQLASALASAPVAKLKRAPVDDWRVQAIAECLESEWDDMTPDQAEADARLIVGYLIEYEKESDRIEAKHAAEPVEPIVQAIRNLRASAPVAGEAKPAIGYLKRDKGRTDWSMTRAAYDLPDGIHMLYAAPQASEAVPVAWAIFSPSGNIRYWHRDKSNVDAFAAKHSLTVCGLANAGPTSKDAEQIADLVLGHAEGLRVSSLLESGTGFGKDVEHRFQVSNGEDRYGVVIILTALSAQPGAQRTGGSDAD